MDAWRLGLLISDTITKIRSIKTVYFQSYRGFSFFLLIAVFKGETWQCNGENACKQMAYSYKTFVLLGCSKIKRFRNSVRLTQNVNAEPGGGEVCSLTALHICCQRAGTLLMFRNTSILVSWGRCFGHLL